MEVHIQAKATKYNYVVALFATLGSFTYAFNSVIFGSVLDLSSFFTYFKIVPDSSYGASIIDAANGLFTAGGFFGCLLIHWMSDALGRRLSIQLVAVVCVISAALQSGSVHIAMFLAGRTLSGLASGMINCLIPLFLSEISPPAKRGRIAGFHGASAGVAYGTACWCGLGVYFAKDPQLQWRLLLALQICAPLLLFAGSPFLPESPRWLIMKGRDAEGLAVLKRLHSSTSHLSDHDAIEEFVQIQAQLGLERSKTREGLPHLLMKSPYRKRLLMPLSLQIVCQTTGILVVSNYMVIELSHVGITGWLPLLVLGVYNTWAGICNIFSAMVVDRVGRMRSICLGLSGCVIFMSIVTGLVANHSKAGNTNRAGAAASIAMMFCFVTCYAAGVDAPSYVYCAEIFPTYIRSQGIGFATSGVFLMNTVLLTAGGTAFTNIGWRFYLLFIIVPAMSLPVIYACYPETKGLSLEEIGTLFGDEIALTTPIQYTEEPEVHQTFEKVDKLDAISA